MTAPSDAAPADHAPPRDDEASVVLEPLALVRAANLGRSAPVLASTPLGTLDAGAIADVDPAGSVHLRGAGWSLDWWVGAEDRWHHPSREAAVRQHPLGDAPVVETAMRVPGGDVLHRAFGVRATAAAATPAEVGATWDDSGIVVEVENLTAVPVALAFAVRPFTLGGTGRIERVEVDGPVVRVDGRVALVLSRVAARAAHGRPGEPSERLVAGDDVDGAELSVTAGPDGLEVALVVPLPHSAIARVLLPRPAAPSRRPRLLRTGPTPVEPSGDWDAPDAAAVVSGWEAQTRAAAAVELPEPLLDQVVAASQRSLILAAGDEFLRGSAPAAVVCEALARSGLGEPLEPLARALVAAQRLNGMVKLEDGSDGSVALLHAAAPLLPASPRWVEGLLGPVAKVVHRLGKGEGLGHGPAARSAAEALARCVPALRAIEQPEVADEAERLSSQLADTAGTSAASISPAGTGVFAAVDDVRRRLRSADAAAIVDLVELARLGEPGAVADRIDDSGVPAGSLGFDPAAVASRLCAVLDLVLLEGAAGPVLLPAWPEVWWGQPLEVHRVRTRWGLVSFGIRWHGERPALLWEIEPAPGVDPSGPAPTLGIPTLDPTWSGSAWSGEALLAPVAVPSTFVAIRGSAVSPGAASASGPSTPVAPVDDERLDPPPEGMTFS